MDISKAEFKNFAALTEYICRCSLRSWELYLEITARGEYRAEYALPFKQVKPETYSYQKGFALRRKYSSELTGVQKIIETLFGDKAEAIINEISYGVFCLFMDTSLFPEGGEYLSPDIITKKKKQLSGFKATYKKINEISEEINFLKDDPTYSFLLSMTGSNSLTRLDEKASRVRTSSLSFRKGTPDIIGIIDQISLELKRIEAKSPSGKYLDKGLAWIFHVFNKRLKVKQFNVKPSEVKWLFDDAGMKLAIEETKTSRGKSVIAACLAYQVVRLFFTREELTFGKISNARKTFPFNTSEGESKFIREYKSYDIESARSWHIVENMGNKTMRNCADTVFELREKVFSHLRSNQEITIRNLASLRDEHRAIIKANQVRMKTARARLVSAETENKIGLSQIALGLPLFVGDEFTLVKS